MPREQIGFLGVVFYHFPKVTPQVLSTIHSRCDDRNVRRRIMDTLIDEDTEKKAVWQIVGEPEADAKKGKISITSPLARALVGKKKGAQVEVNTPGGGKSYEIAKVAWR